MIGLGRNIHSYLDTLAVDIFLKNNITCSTFSISWLAWLESRKTRRTGSGGVLHRRLIDQTFEIIDRRRGCFSFDRVRCVGYVWCVLLTMRFFEFLRLRGLSGVLTIYIRIYGAGGEWLQGATRIRFIVIRILEKIFRRWVQTFVVAP